MSAGTSPARARGPYKMKDLCDATGLPRQAIHFYIQQGLLPPGHKTGRNMAWYGEAHLERLRLIKQLQHERFLPLKAIKALLDGSERSFSPEQRRFLAEVKQRLQPSVADADRRRDVVPGDELVAATGVTMHDLERGVELGLLADRRDARGRLVVARDDAWIFELLGEMRRIGFTRELGFEIDDLVFYDELLGRVFEEEVRLLSGRLADHPPDEVARMIERALPIIGSFLSRYHERSVRDFFSHL